MSAVNAAAALDPLAFARDFAVAAKAARFRAEPFGEHDGVPLVAYTRRTPGPRPRIYLSAGIHGDEPAPPRALLRMMELGLFDERATWFLVPLLNPTGFRLGMRENRDGLDLNRDYLAPRSAEVTAHVRWLQNQPRFDLGIMLHEDWESRGFYLYELNHLGLPSIASAFIAAARQHCPIEAAELIDGRPIAEPGIIRPVNDPLERVDWPEAIYVRAHHCALTYTLETPSALHMDQRITTLAHAVGAALDAYFNPAR